MRSHRPTPLATVVVAAAVALGWACSPVVAVETSFQLHFVPGSTYLSGPRIRWNTHSLISAFGMEHGGRLELQVTDIYVDNANTTDMAVVAPVVFSLYDIEQWRAYSVLKLRDVPLRSDFVLCHYPSAVRFAVPPPTEESGLPWTLTFDVSKPSLYTLQVQVCGEASVYVTGRASLVNVGYDGELSEHLGIEELGLRPLYKLYLVGMLLWVLECYVWCRNIPVRKPILRLKAELIAVSSDALNSRFCVMQKISYAFQAVLQVKALSVALKLGFYSQRSARGDVTAFLDVAQDLGESATSAALLGVAALGSLGWSITRATLSRREVLALAMLAMLYLIVTVNKALCRPADTQQCRAYMLAEYALQSVHMLGVIVALNFTIAQLKQTISQERWNCFVTPLTYMKLDQFQ
ncbi:hypothetical protein BBJ28_00011149 [Nothophytophthora sp. Chile5]|nr:hypothetical protein BBJ28_00011149 [Nothophytophthora sp. Chile5]